MSTTPSAVSTVTDTLAPSALPYFVDRPAALLLNAAFLVAVLPATLAWNTLLHLIRGPLLPSWTLRNLLLTRVLKAYLSTVFFFGLPGPDRYAARIRKSMIRKGMKVEAVQVPPVQDRRRIGWADCEAVTSEPVPSFMIWPGNVSKKHGEGMAPAQANERIIIYFVGGGFISGHPLRTHLAWSVSKWLDTRIFAVNYRKALDSSSAFPAPLIDALAGWSYVTEKLGFKPENITLMGDSAGANLCLALARYLNDLKLAEKGEDLGQPGGMILFSPWVDMTSSGESSRSNAPYDYVSPLGSRSVRTYIRHFPQSIATPYFSPSLPSIDGSPRFSHLKNTRVYIQTGTAELLYTEDLQLTKGMKDEGIDVRLREIKDDIHVGILFKLKPSMEATQKDLKEFWGLV